MSRTTSIIPEELEAIISSLKPGKPTWTLYKTEKGYAGSFSGRTIAMEAVLHLMPTQVGDTSVVSDTWRNSFRKSMRKASIDLIRTPKKRYKVQPNPKLMIFLHLQLRCEIRNSSPNAASQQQFADPVEWKDPSCAQQTTSLETRGDVESGGLIRDADRDLHKSPEPLTCPSHTS